MCRRCGLHHSAITPVALSPSRAELAARSLLCPQSALAHTGTAPTTFTERINKHVKLGRGTLVGTSGNRGACVRKRERYIWGQRERRDPKRLGEGHKAKQECSKDILGCLQIVPVGTILLQIPSTTFLSTCLSQSPLGPGKYEDFPNSSGLCGGFPDISP